MKNFLTWIFYGLFVHCTLQEYNVICNFVGPPRKTMYQECQEIMARMDERLERSRLQSVETNKFIKKHQRLLDERKGL